MPHNANTAFRRKKHRMIAMCVVVVAVVLALVSPKVVLQFQERSRLLKEQQVLTAKLTKLQAQNQRLVIEQNQLKDDTYGENKAREKYGLVKPDELVFDLKN